MGPPYPPHRPDRLARVSILDSSALISNRKFFRFRGRAVEPRVPDTAAQRNDDTKPSDRRGHVPKDEDPHEGQRNLVQCTRDAVRGGGRYLHAPKRREGHHRSNENHHEQAHQRPSGGCRNGAAHVWQRGDTAGKQKGKAEEIVVENGAIATNFTTHIPKEPLHIQHVRHGEANIGECPEKTPRRDPLVSHTPQVAPQHHESKRTVHWGRDVLIEQVLVPESGEYDG
mmetsp:Transcript_61583/g.71651  ORF Transcript_61583/g.71651 Transcript_61583/m.71651 type:complete len:227 (+) Transcript_61583:114-794(+)